MSTRRRTTTRIEVSSDRGVFMISVAAELADMHPQTLRMYEQRGLIEPKRSPKGTRLYSHEDVERLRRIQQMTAELGLNLAGVEKVLELESQLERTRRRGGPRERPPAEREAASVGLGGGRAEGRADNVGYEKAKGSALVRVKDVKPFTIPIERR
jgi:MerR family transcriptional regulator/heat shock protein HspR